MIHGEWLKCCLHLKLGSDLFLKVGLVTTIKFMVEVKINDLDEQPDRDLIE